MAERPFPCLWWARSIRSPPIQQASSPGHVPTSRTRWARRRRGSRAAPILSRPGAPTRDSALLEQRIAAVPLLRRDRQPHASCVARQGRFGHPPQRHLPTPTPRRPSGRRRTTIVPDGSTRWRAGHLTAERAISRGAGPAGESCATESGYSPLSCASVQECPLKPRLGRGSAVEVRRGATRPRFASFVRDRENRVARRTSVPQRWVTQRSARYASVPQLGSPRLSRT
jgi:hypothetical protein